MNDLRLMKNAHQTLVNVEVLMVGKSDWMQSIIGSRTIMIWMPLRFLLEGFKLLLRQAMVWSVLMFAGMAITLLVWSKFVEPLGTDHRYGAALFNEVSIILIVVCGLIAFFSVPSNYSSYKIDDVLLDQVLAEFRKTGLADSAQTRSALIDSVEESSKSRVRTWITLAALLWGIYMLSIRSMVQGLTVEITSELTALLFVVLFIWLIASAYSAATKKLIFLLKFADSAILDHDQKAA